VRTLKRWIIAWCAVPSWSGTLIGLLCFIGTLVMYHTPQQRCDKALYCLAIGTIVTALLRLVRRLFMSYAGGREGIFIRVDSEGVVIDHGETIWGKGKNVRWCGFGFYSTSSPKVHICFKERALTLTIRFTPFISREDLRWLYEHLPPRGVGADLETMVWLALQPHLTTLPSASEMGTQQEQLDRVLEIIAQDSFRNSLPSNLGGFKVRIQPKELCATVAIPRR